MSQKVFCNSWWYNLILRISKRKCFWTLYCRKQWHGLTVRAYWNETETFTALRIRFQWDYGDRAFFDLCISPFRFYFHISSQMWSDRIIFVHTHLLPNPMQQIGSLSYFACFIALMYTYDATNKSSRLVISYLILCWLVTINRIRLSSAI